MMSNYIEFAQAKRGRGKDKKPRKKKGNMSASKGALLPQSKGDLVLRPKNALATIPKKRSILSKVKEKINPGSLKQQAIKMKAWIDNKIPKRKKVVPIDTPAVKSIVENIKAEPKPKGISPLLLGGLGLAGAAGVAGGGYAIYKNKKNKEKLNNENQQKQKT